MVIDSNTLMGQRFDHGDFGSKGWVEEIPIGEAFTFNYQSHDLGVRCEIYRYIRFCSRGSRIVVIVIVSRLLVERQTFLIALLHKVWIPSLFPTNNVAKIKY